MTTLHRLLLASWLVPLSLGAQDIAGVKLRQTKLNEVLRIRGNPDDRGNLVDGSAMWLRYGQHLLYFNSGDSTATGVRFAPDKVVRREVEAVFGKPLKSERSFDFTVTSYYSDTSSVVHQRDSVSVIFIQYLPRRVSAPTQNASTEVFELYVMYLRHRLLSALAGQCFLHPRMDTTLAFRTLRRHATMREDSVGLPAITAVLRRNPKTVCTTLTDSLK
jgi:hypothetical protein